ncbi:MAG: hypothetical protein NVS1B13_10470 [Flavisolibacter sp.]
MRKAFLFFLLLLALSLGYYYFSKPPATLSSLYETDNDKPTNEFSLALKEEHALLVDPKTGKIPADAHEKELLQAWQIRNNQLGRGYSGDKILFNTYNFQGPNNLGGRTRALAFDISDATGNTMISGSVSGGVFKTTDGGLTWTRVNTSAQHYSITSIAQDTRPGSQNIWYYSTGESIGNSGAEDGDNYMGDGIYKSIDGGNTWNRLPASNTGSTFTFDRLQDLITTVAVNPVNGDVYAACITIIMRSQDGGTTWSTVLDGLTNTPSSMTDVVITNSGRVYAALSGSTGSGMDGVYTSPTGNSGSFLHIAGTGSASTPVGWDAVNGYGRVILALVPTNQNLLYVLYYNNVNSTCTAPAAEAKFFRFDQSLTSWTDLSASLPNEAGCSVGNNPFAVQQGYDMAIAIKPDNANTVFIGGTNVYRSTDLGATWTRIGGYANSTSYALYANHHSDIHTLKFSPANSSILFTGDDGGLQKGDITVSTVNWTSLNNDYRTYQYYHVAIKQESGVNDFIGGAQDNGTTNGMAGSASMSRIFSGDGASVGLGAGATNYKQYVSVNSGPILRRNSTLAPNTYEVDLTPTNAGLGSIFVTYFYLDADNPENLYYAAQLGGLNKLFRITNASTATNASWQTFAFNFTGYIRSMVATRGSYTAASRLYIGTDQNKIYCLNDPLNAIPATATPVDITPAASAVGATVVGLAVNPQNQDQLLAVYSNYNVVHAFYTANAGSATPTWTAVEGNLNYPSYRSCMILNTASGPEYYVGTSVGLYKTTLMNGVSTAWSQEAIGLIGNALVTSLDLRVADNNFAIGTHGMGMWKGSSNSVLPVKYENFSGHIMNNNAYLNWSTSRETNNRGFEVERSYDGQLFHNIGFVYGAGNINKISSYGFKDEDIVQSENYYRLKQIDLEGRAVYSPIVLLKASSVDQQGMKILGNPFTNFIDIALPAVPSQNIWITITNLSGNMVYKGQHNAGLSRIRVPVDKLNLSRGLYILQVIDGNKKYLAKIYKR